LLDSTLFLEDLLPSAGFRHFHETFPGQEDEIRFGVSIAKRSPGMDIGLSVFIKDKAVIAVEDIEHRCHDKARRKACRPGGYRS
jgi:DUF1009 family protein